MTNATIRFIAQPRTRRIALHSTGITLLELARAAVDSDGREWAAGTQLQPLSHGNSGYCYTVVRAV